MTLSKKAFVFIILLSILVLAFLLRVYFSYGFVFSSPIKYAGDDGVYHVRIIENELLGGHFPSRIYFDPYTNFPSGTYIHFAPLYDHLPAFFIWILTLGNPTQKIIDTVVPFYPPVLGVLSVLIVFFLGRVLWGNAAGLIAALIAAIAPMLVFRSLLGETDHHVAEVLFSSLAMLCLFYLLKFQEEGKIYSAKWWGLTVLTGITLSLYFLVWEGAPLFLFLFFLFLVSYSIYQYFLNKPWKHFLWSGAVIFSIVLVVLIPFLGHPNLFLSPLYNFRHIGSLLFGLISFLLIWVLGELFSRKKVKPVYFLASFLLIGLLLITLVYFLFPGVSRLLIEGFKAINTSLSPHENAKELTGEMKPTTIGGAMETFLGFLFFSLAGLIIIIYRFIKQRQGVNWLIVIWFLLVFEITGIFPSSVGQNKYLYYLWVVVALLSAFFLEQAFIFAWRGLKIIQEKDWSNSPLFLYALIGSLLTIFCLLVFLLYPFPFNIAASYPENLPLLIRSTIAMSKGVIQWAPDWYDSLKWLRENTPAPSLDYYALYQEPGVDSKTGKILPYNYPADSYGVLARWDFGHVITYYAHRMAVSNPFHQGIGKKDPKTGRVLELGDGVFFLETDENIATKYLDQMKVRYLMTDSSYAQPEGLFKEMIKWVQVETKDYTEEDVGSGPSKFDNSMIARLHILDGRATTTERKEGENILKFEIKPLVHFRLVYESVTTDNSAFKGDVKMVKIFEYVKGAKISGRTNGKGEITISTTIKTNQNREFTYQQSAVIKDGQFEFIVPYSTFGAQGRLKDQTQFVVFADPYKIKIGGAGGREAEIKVFEEDVLNGNVSVVAY